MRCAVRPWITAGVAVTGAGMIAVTPVAPPLPGVQERSVQLTANSIITDFVTSVEQGLGSFDSSLTSPGGFFSELTSLGLGALVNPSVAGFPLVGLEGLVSNTTTNVDALLNTFEANPFPIATAPGLQQGLTAVYNDVLANLQTILSGKPLTDIFANPVLNPVSLLTLPALTSLNSLDGPNATLAGLAGIGANIEAALKADDFTTVLNNLELAPTTLLNDYLNGYPVGFDAATGVYTLDRPLNDVITPEFGLLTGPNGSTPLATGTIESLFMARQTLADELSSAGGVNLPTGPLTVEGPGNVALTFHLDQIPGLGSIISKINGALGDICNAIGICLPSIPTDPMANIPLGEITAPSIEQYILDLAKDDTAVAGTINLLPEMGTVPSTTLADLLAPEPILNLGATFNDFFASLGLPVLDINLSLPLNITNSLAEGLNVLFSLPI